MDTQKRTKTNRQHKPKHIHIKNILKTEIQNLYNWYCHEKNICQRNFKQPPNRPFFY